MLASAGLPVIVRKPQKNVMSVDAVAWTNAAALADAMEGIARRRRYY
jgi:hypothetical protein